MQVVLRTATSWWLEHQSKNSWICPWEATSLPLLTSDRPSTLYHLPPIIHYPTVFNAECLLAFSSAIGWHYIETLIKQPDKFSFVRVRFELRLLPAYIQTDTATERGITSNLHWASGECHGMCQVCCGGRWVSSRGTFLHVLITVLLCMQTYLMHLFCLHMRQISLFSPSPSFHFFIWDVSVDAVTSVALMRMSVIAYYPHRK